MPQDNTEMHLSIICIMQTVILSIIMNYSNWIIRQMQTKIERDL